MPKQDKEVVIKGNCAVAISKSTQFNPHNPEKTAVQDFTFINSFYVKEGVLDKSWLNSGYILVGNAEITVRLMPHEEITETAIAVLREQKKHVQAQAQRAIDDIDSRIQNMLALPYIPEVMEV